MDGKLETVHTLVELGVDKEAKSEVRNLMMMMMMMMMTFSVVTIMMIVGDDKGDCDGDDHGLVD